MAEGIGFEKLGLCGRLLVAREYFKVGLDWSDTFFPLFTTS